MGSGNENNFLKAFELERLNFLNEFDNFYNKLVLDLKENRYNEKEFYLIIIAKAKSMNRERLKRNRGGRPEKTCTKMEQVFDTPTLSELGIDKKISSLSQKEAILYATSIKVEALRQLGNMLKETERNRGGRPEKTCTKTEQVFDTPRLSELGIDRKISSLSHF